MFSSTPIRLSPVFNWHVVKEGFAIREARLPKWARSPEGYERHFSLDGEESIIYGRKHGERIVVPSGQHFNIEQRCPLANAALFMNFAQLECSETSVLGFINQHGYLRMDAKWELAYQRRRAEVDPTTEDEADNRFFDAFHFFGESIEEWYSEIRMMRFAIDLWAANREQSSAKQLVALVERHQQALEATHNSEQFRSEWRSLKTPREALATVHSLVLSRINGGAFDHTLSWSFAEILPHNRYILEITPESLGVGLWLQLATAIAADAHYRQCEFSGCRGFFDAENCRKSRRYCSDSCKTRAYNKRQMTR